MEFKSGLFLALSINPLLENIMENIPLEVLQKQIKEFCEKADAKILEIKNSGENLGENSQ